MTAQLRGALWGLAILLAPAFASAQKDKETVIYLANPSFEDIPRCCEAPSGWINCGSPSETPPDVQPGFFDVGKPASHGNTYVGMVVRDNETWEAIGQRLSRPLEVNQCYDFSLDLCRSEFYTSMSRKTNERADYLTPVVVRIWGGNNACQPEELLDQTPIVTHPRWIPFTFKLRPKKASYTYIMIEAYYRTPILFPYNGNVLIDNASPIKQVFCNPEKMPDTPPQPTAPATTEKRKPAPTSDTAAATKKEPKEAPSPRPVEPETSSIDRSKIRKGMVLRLEKIHFDANQYAIKEECLPALEDLFKFLRNNPDVTVEVRGHTNNRVTNEALANQLSTMRAKSVADWLIDKGIASARVQYKGYGWTQPLEPNTTPEGRQKNQRVEIKILSMK